MWPLEMDSEFANHDYTLILFGPSKQWPGTSLHIGVGGVLGHPPGAFTHCGNWLGSPGEDTPGLSKSKPNQKSGHSAPASRERRQGGASRVRRKDRH